mgnify:CR=1 FL=1
MPNRLNLPDNLEKLIEKREIDRRQEESSSDAKEPQSETPPNDRRQGPGRRVEDQS